MPQQPGPSSDERAATPPPRMQEPLLAVKCPYPTNLYDFSTDWNEHKLWLVTFPLLEEHHNAKHWEFAMSHNINLMEKLEGVPPCYVLDAWDASRPLRFHEGVWDPETGITLNCKSVANVFMNGR